jgi:hypothetical protein
MLTSGTRSLVRYIVFFARVEWLRGLGAVQAVRKPDVQMVERACDIASLPDWCTRPWYGSL